MEEKIKTFLSVVDGSGSGYGSGYGLKSFKNMNIYLVDGLQTIFEKIKGNVATGYILNNVFTLSKCFIVKDGRFFAHGKTLREAIQSLNEKNGRILTQMRLLLNFARNSKRESATKA